MTPSEKLAKLYEIKNELHPLSLIVVDGLTKLRKDALLVYDIEFVETIYPLYFKEEQTTKEHE